MRRVCFQPIAAAMTVVVLMLGCGDTWVAGQKSSGARTIEGVWRTSVTPRNCETGVPLGPVFPGILMFNNGGTMTGTSTAVSSVYGTWSRSHGNTEYAFTTLAFRYDPAGQFIGTRRITQNVVLDEGGDKFASNGTFQDFNLAGEPLPPGGPVPTNGCASSAGYRFE